MRLTVLESNDAARNLACEDALLSSGGERFLLWRNSPSVIIGRHQNAHAEADAEYAKINGIKIVRRLSGGGAVYHDLGNINFSVIKKYDKNETDPGDEPGSVLFFLRGLGIPAEAKGRNDFVANGKKISGTARTVRDGRLLCHGTILFDADLNAMERVLTVSGAKYESRGVASIRGRVANLREFLPDMTAEGFWERIVEYYSRIYDSKPITEAETVNAEKLQVERYESWDWNFGASPKYSYEKTMRTDAGTLTVYARVDKGIIEEIKICGDFFSFGGVEEIERALVGAKREAEELGRILLTLPIGEIIINLNAQQLLSALV